MKVVIAALLLLLNLSSIHVQSQKRIITHPFLGWTAIADQLHFAAIELELVGQNTNLLSNKLAPTDAVRIKVIKPRGFGEMDGKVNFGIGVLIKEALTDSVLYQVYDIYQNQESVEAEMLDYLSLKFNPDPTDPIGKVYLIEARFFDKNSPAEVLVKLPVEVAEKSDAIANVENYSSWSIPPSVRIMGQQRAVEGAAILLANNALSTLEVPFKSKLTFQLPKGTAAAKYYYSFTDTAGTVVATSTGVSKKGLIVFELADLPQAPLLLTLKAETPEGRFGFSEWFFITNTFLTEKQRTDFFAIHLQRARQLQEGGHTKDAQQVYYTARMFRPETAKGQYDLAWLANEIALYKQALSILDELIKTSPDLIPEYYQERVYANKKLKNTEAVVADYRTLSDKFQNNANWLYEIGYYYNELKLAQKAVAPLREALDRAPYNYKINYELAYTLKVLGKPKEALKYFIAAEQMGNDVVSDMLFIHKGDCYRALNNNNTACRQYQIAKEKGVRVATERLRESCN
jgi:tetratricopeptide (TPR) repeat protein